MQNFLTFQMTDIRSVDNMLLLVPVYRLLLDAYVVVLPIDNAMQMRMSMENGNR